MALSLFVPFFAPLCVAEVFTLVPNADVGTQTDCPDKNQHDIDDFASVKRDVVDQLEHH